MNVALILSHNRDMVTLETLRVDRRDQVLRLAEEHGAHNLRKKVLRVVLVQREMES